MHPDLILDRLKQELTLGKVKSHEECFDATKSQETAWEKWKMQPSPCDKNVDVVILVKSSIDRNGNRRIIRKTWARKVKVETETFKLFIRPIFLIGVLNSDDQLPKFCPGVSLILLSDDDAVIVPWLFFGQLVPVTKIVQNPNENYFGGVPFFMSLVPRTFKLGSRAEIPVTSFPCSTMPIYLQGFAMVFSMGTLKRLVEEMHKYYSIAFSDDVYLSWLAYRLKINVDEYSTDLFEGSCLVEENQHPSVYEKHAKNDRVESVAVVHQCDTAELQKDLWIRLCESFIVNNTLI
uniref:Hexosyltransferase n=1 Tax=Romanomermis culicivorax TaxID=13658 RepID=A0A915KN98_ROMCU